MARAPPPYTHTHCSLPEGFSTSPSPHNPLQLTGQSPGHPQSPSTQASVFFTCWGFYFNLKQMVEHRCEQLWPCEHKEGTGLDFEHARLPTYWPIPLVPSSPLPPCTTITDRRPPARAPSSVPSQEGGPPARSGWLDRLGVTLGQVPGVRHGWSVFAPTPPFISHDAEDPRRSLGPGNMGKSGSEAWAASGKERGAGISDLTPPQAPPASLSQPPEGLSASSQLGAQL